MFVFVLAVADSQHALDGFRSDHEFESVHRRIDGVERDRAVVVLARRRMAVATSEIHHYAVLVVADLDEAEFYAWLSRNSPVLLVVELCYEIFTGSAVSARTGPRAQTGSPSNVIFFSARSLRKSRMTQDN